MKFRKKEIVAEITTRNKAQHLVLLETGEVWGRVNSSGARWSLRAGPNPTAFALDKGRAIKIWIDIQTDAGHNVLIAKEKVL